MNTAASSIPSTLRATTVIELRVHNHPGTMAHVTGLFARRGFNLEAILCVPIASTTTSAMLLLVAETPRLDQVEQQLRRLYDVIELRHRDDLDAATFTGAAALIGLQEGSPV